jgi:hypothetical protein
MFDTVRELAHVPVGLLFPFLVEVLDCAGPLHLVALPWALVEVVDASLLALPAHFIVFELP